MYAQRPGATDFSSGGRYNCAMKIIYADSVFLLDLIADYFLCLVSARACGLILRRGRYLAAAFLGAAYSVAVYLPGMSFLTHPAIMVCVGLLMGLVSFGGEKRVIKCCAVFLAVSAAFGGAIWGICLAGGIKLPAPGRVLLLAFALCYALLSLVTRNIAVIPERARAEVCVTLGEKTVRFVALLDSGNALTDPIDGAPVMVASPNALAALFASPLPSDPIALVTDVPELAGRARLISFSSVGGRGLLGAFRPDSVTVSGDRKEKILVAVSCNVCGDGFEAVL